MRKKTCERRLLRIIATSRLADIHINLSSRRNQALRVAFVHQ